MVPWFFFSDAVNAVTNCLLEYSYLVKKVVFNIELLPIVKIISTLIVHVAFIVLLFIISFITGNRISFYSIQLIYYLVCMIALVYAIGLVTSALILFFRDLGQIVSIILQIGVWATPIIWPYTTVPEKFRWIVKLNPVFYVVEGYRNCFFQEKWFFEKPVLTSYFWVVAIICLFVGKMVFQKMKPQFADVL